MKYVYYLPIALLGAFIFMKPGSQAQSESKRHGETLKLYSIEKGGFIMLPKVIKTNEEWQKQLTPEQYKVARKKGTERAFTGEYWNNHAEGIYHCVACGNDLFRSDAKFESGTGWPSFWKPVSKENVTEE